jgi:phage shock protein A
VSACEIGGFPHDAEDPVPRNPKPLPTPEAAIANLRHGLVSRTLALPGLEDHADWVRYREKVVESLQPEGELETELATAVAEYTWRRRRVARHETHLVAVERERDTLKDGWQEYKKRIEDMENKELAVELPDQAEQARSAARQLYGDMIMHRKIDQTVKPERMLPAADDLDRIIRYETHLMRQAYHALHELQALQARRRGEPAPLARLSVLGFSA